MDEARPTYTIKDLAESERPRERLARLGAGALKNEELLAILLRVGTRGENAIQVGQRLIETFGGITGIHQASYDEVCAQHGIGPAKAAQIKAALELGYRMKIVERKDTPIQSPGDAAERVKFEMSALEQEELRVILLDTRNRVIQIVTVYRGSLNSSQVRVGELFRSAIRKNAASIILAHNHPSGDPNPSPDDIVLTRAVVEAGRLLDIEVLDHLVIGGLNHFSLKEHKLGFG
jgi:DNA repair protein RadC